MEGMIRSTQQPPGAITIEAIEGMRALWALETEPLILGYHPVAKLNPFQTLLYREVWDAGIIPVPVVRLDGLRELGALAALGHQTVLHLHWLGQPLADVTTAGQADKAVDAFLGGLDDFIAPGGRIVWTVHNVLSHDSRFEAIEARMHAEIAARASVIHVLTKVTPDLVHPYYIVPIDRTIYVPHPSYAGAYEDIVSRSQARHELGLMPDEHVYLAMGAIRPYKGLPDLLDVWDELPPDPPRRLIIAGQPGHEARISEMLERAAIHPRVLIHPFTIPSGQMQLFLRAADVAVLPYHRSLNSGALMLALTFGVPAIVPANSGMAECVDGRSSIIYDPDAPRALADAVLRAGDLATPTARESALAIAAERDPSTLSRRFALELRRMLDG